MCQQLVKAKLMQSYASVSNVIRFCGLSFKGPIILNLFRRSQALGKIIALLCLCVITDLVHGKELVLEELARDVFAVMTPAGHPGQSNGGFILLEDSVIVIDTHMAPEAARELMARIRKITTHPVRYVINTHWHSDHTIGNTAYREAYGPNVEFISHIATREDIATLGQVRLEINQARIPTLADVELLLPNLTFSHEFNIHSGDRRIQLLFFGKGHTRGDIIVYLPEEKIAFVGDLITSGPPFARDGYPFAWIETLESLQKLDINTIITGHGKIWRSKDVLVDRIRFQKYATDIVRKGAAKGLTVQAIADAIDLEIYKDTFVPAKSPWEKWMLDFAKRGLLELGENKEK